MNKLYCIASIIGIGASVRCACIATTIGEAVLASLLALTFTCVLIRRVVMVSVVKKFEQHLREQSEVEYDSRENEDEDDQD